MPQIRFILSALIVAVCSIYANQSLAETPVFSNKNVAIAGYDPVAYFLDEKALAGNEKYSYRWQGVDWWFTSQQHRDLFISDPDSYSPMFGGFCSLGAAHGALVPSDPNAWTVHKGQLFLNQSSDVTTTWRYNLDDNIQRGKSHFKAAIENYQQRLTKSKTNKTTQQETQQ